MAIRPAIALSAITSCSDYFDEIRTQSSWARIFSACQSDATTSQFTMVRLVCASGPLAIVDVRIESTTYAPPITSTAPRIIPRIDCMSNPPVTADNAVDADWFPLPERDDLRHEPSPFSHFSIS